MLSVLSKLSPATLLAVKAPNCTVRSPRTGKEVDFEELQVAVDQIETYEEFEELSWMNSGKQIIWFPRFLTFITNSIIDDAGPYGTKHETGINSWPILYAESRDHAQECASFFLSLPRSPKTEVEIFGYKSVAPLWLSSKTLTCMFHAGQKGAQDTCYIFCQLQLDQDQSRAIANSRSNVTIDYCTFSDGGKAFLQEYKKVGSDNGGATAGSLKLICRQDQEMFCCTDSWHTLFAADRPDEHLQLSGFKNKTDECNALAIANRKHLTFSAQVDGYIMQDDGDALAKALESHKLGPKGLTFEKGGQLSPGFWMKLFCALSTDHKLKVLAIEDSGFLFDSEEHQAHQLLSALTNSVRRNIGLEEFTLSLEGLEKETVNSVVRDFFRSLCSHPNLRRLSLYVDVSVLKASDYLSFIDGLVEMLQQNKRIEEINVGPKNKKVPWVKVSPRVAGMLHCNAYSNKVHSLYTSADCSSCLSSLATTNGLFGAAIARLAEMRPVKETDKTGVQSNPRPEGIPLSKLYLLLSGNCDLLVSAHGSA